MQPAAEHPAGKRDQSAGPAGPGRAGSRPPGPDRAGSRAPDPGRTGSRSGPRRRVGVLLAVAAVVLAADIVSKAIVVATLSGRPCRTGAGTGPLRVIGGFLTLCESRNSGAAFGIGTSMTVVFTIIAVGVIIFILRASRRISSVGWAVTLGLLLGGAMGNLTDRLFRAPGPLRGWVVDWIQLPHWPVFNLADSAIVCGGALAVLLAARGIRIDGTRAGQGPPGGQDPGGQRSGGQPSGGQHGAGGDR